MESKKVIGFSAFGITFFALMLEFIYNIVNANDVGSDYTFIFVTTLVAELVGMILCIVGLFRTYNDNDESSVQKLHFLALIFYIVTGVIQVIYIIARIKDIGSYYGVSVDIPATVIVRLVLLIIVALFLLIACFIDSYLYTGARFAVASFAYLIFAILIIIGLAEGESDEGLPLVSSILFIIIGLLGILYSYIVMQSTTYHSRKRTPYVPRTTYSSNSSSMVSNANTVSNVQQTTNESIHTKEENPAEKLKELKSLFDSGIITEEEYKEARQKYISKL